MARDSMQPNPILECGSSSYRLSLLNADDGSSSSRNRLSIRTLRPDVAERRRREQQFPQSHLDP